MRAIPAVHSSTCTLLREFLMIRRDNKKWPVSQNITRRLERRLAWTDEFAELDEKVRFAAKRLGFDLDDEKTTLRLLNNVAMDRAERDLENANQAKFAEYFLSMAYAQLLILSNDPSDREALGALCRGNWMVGLLANMDNEDIGQRVCLPCALHEQASRNGKAGAAKKLGPIRELEKWARQKYSEKKWPSANKAAYEMKDEILAHGRSIGAVLTEQNAQRTIAAWLRKK